MDTTPYIWDPQYDSTMLFDVQRVRSEFPSLSVRDNDKPRVYFDNPGGTQVAQRVIDRTVQYYSTSNSNHGGSFSTSIASDVVLSEAHAAVAAFLNASSADEVVFGQNMTSLTFAISRSLGRTMKAGDEIVVSRMDHDANISPWLLLADDLDLTVRWLDFDPETFRYDLHGLDNVLSDRTRLVAVNHASNAIGTINDVRQVAEKAHAAGALVYVDSVQFAPHAAIDVQALNCDFLVCSAYKFFGPHQGMLWGKRSVLEQLEPYKVRSADDNLPFRFETGTLSHEGLAGTLGAIEYLEWLGAEMGEPIPALVETSDRTRVLHSAMNAICSYEQKLCADLIDGLQDIEGLRIFGLTHPADLVDRVPTVSFTLAGFSPAAVTQFLAAQNIFAWEGDYYAVEVVRRLGLAESGGMVRVGLAHYNTPAEIDSLITTLKALNVGRVLASTGY